MRSPITVRDLNYAASLFQPSHSLVPGSTRSIINFYVYIISDIAATRLLDNVSVNCLTRACLTRIKLGRHVSNEYVGNMGGMGESVVLSES